MINSTDYWVGTIFLFIFGVISGNVGTLEGNIFAIISGAVVFILSLGLIAYGVSG